MNHFDRLTVSAAPAREMHTLGRLRVESSRVGRAVAKTRIP